MIRKPGPVAWMQNDMEHFSLWPDEWHVVPLYTAPPQRERIVYCGCGDGIVPDDGAECGACVSMRQREWQGLTDDEIDNTFETQVWDSRRSYARAIEAKLREKNT